MTVDVGMALVVILCAAPIATVAIYKAREFFFGAVPPWHTAYQGNAATALRILLAVSPWPFVLGLFLPFTFMTDSRDPRYLGYTSSWFMASLFFFQPAAFLVTAIGEPISNVPMKVIGPCCAAFLSIVLWKIVPNRRRSKGSAA